MLLATGKLSETQALCERVIGKTDLGRLIVKSATQMQPICDIQLDLPRWHSLIAKKSIGLGFGRQQDGSLGQIVIERYDHTTVPLFASIAAISMAVYFLIRRMWLRKMRETLQSHVDSVAEISDALNRAESTAELRKSLDVLALHSVEISSIAAAIVQFTKEVDDLRKIEVSSAKDKAQKEMLRQLAHDIRSPLSSMKIISGKSKFFADERAQRVLADAVLVIQKQLETAMTHTRVELAGPAQVTFISRLRAIISEVVSLRLISNPEIHFAMALGDIEGSCFVDEEAFRRVIQNLVSNSIESLQALQQPADMKMTIGLRRAECGVEVIVSDSGGGFPEQVLRLGGKVGLSVGKIAGNGLGLSSAFTFASQIHGSIRLRNCEGGGAEVMISIPAEISTSTVLSHGDVCG